MSTSVLKIKLSYFHGSSSYRHSSTELWQHITHLLLGCRTEQFNHFKGDFSNIHFLTEFILLFLMLLQFINSSSLVVVV